MAGLVDSKQQMLNSEDLLRIAAANQQDNLPDSAVIKSIKAELKTPGTLPLRFGNTIFIVHKGRKRTGFFRALNADTPRNYLANSVRFSKEIYDIGFDFLVTQYQDSSINNIFKYISRNPPRKDMGFETQKLQDGTYQSIFQAGPVRSGELGKGGK